MTVFTLAFGGPDAAWMYACSCCSVQCRGTGWVAGQPMLKRLSSYKMQRVRVVASSVEVHCSRCRRQMADKMCSTAVRELALVGIFATWLISKNTRDQSFKTKSKTKTGNAKTKTVSSGLETKTAVSRTTSLTITSVPVDRATSVVQLWRTTAKLLVGACNMMLHCLRLLKTRPIDHIVQ